VHIGSARLVTLQKLASPEISQRLSTAQPANAHDEVSPALAPDAPRWQLRQTNAIVMTANGHDMDAREEPS
jgi:hypothetical protein